MIFTETPLAEVERFERRLAAAVKTVKLHGFAVGDSVSMSPAGTSRDLLSGRHDKARTGKVVGFSLCGGFVRVQRTGERLEDAGSFFPESWEVT